MWLGQSTYNQTYQKPKGGKYLPIPPTLSNINNSLIDKLRFRNN